jgi:hypothetical protein
MVTVATQHKRLHRRSNTLLTGNGERTVTRAACIDHEQQYDHHLSIKSRKSISFYWANADIFLFFCGKNSKMLIYNGARSSRGSTFMVQSSNIVSVYISETPVCIRFIEQYQQWYHRVWSNTSTIISMYLFGSKISKVLSFF